MSDGPTIPMTELTGPEDLVGPAGRIKVNTSDLPMYLAQGYTLLVEQTPEVVPPTDPED